jgi:hypothetical protein
VIRSDNTFPTIRNIDNRPRWLPLASFLSLAFLVVVLIWFFGAVPFVFMPRLFFGICTLTHLSWLSIILVSVAQKVINSLTGRTFKTSAFLAAVILLRIFPF